ncbi:MAG TPA: FliH/SctL family protein [Fimbriimonadales bacterium]|nr:FliH/SctL family protein [Fimbriimonadales bacterium]
MFKKRILPRESGSKFSKLEEQLPEIPKLSSAKEKEPPLPLVSTTHAIATESYQDGFAKGYDAGFREGLHCAKEYELERLKRLESDLETLFARIEHAMELWYEKAESGLARYASDIAKKILAEELTLRPEAIVSLAREAIKRVRNTTNVRIRVNPFDLNTLNERKEELFRIAAGVRGIEIAGDETLERGSVIIETENGILDARIETQLENLCRKEVA